MADNEFTEDEQEVIRLAREAGEKIARYEAGADATPREEGTLLTTPGQLWHKLLGAPEDVRMAMLQAALENAQSAHTCFVMGHEGRLREAEEERELLSIAVFDMPTNDSTRQLHTAVRALRQVMVDGIAARTTTVEMTGELTLEEFPEEPDLRQKIGAQLKSAGIDLQSICGYEWQGDATPLCPLGSHTCGAVNPLHALAHGCKDCSASLSHEEAERLATQ